MRPLIVLLAVLVATPFALGQGQGGGGPGHGGPGGPDGGDGNQTGRGGAACRDADDRRSCLEAYCEEQPEDPQCRRLQEDCERHDCAEASQACLDAAGGRQGDRAEACRELHDLDDIRLDARHVDFFVDRDGRQLLNYSVGGQVLVSSITYGEADEDFEVSRHGNRIRFESADARLEIHDTPTADFWYRGGNGSLVLVFPDNATITPAPRGHLVTYAERTARLAGADVVVDGHTATATGHLAFFSPVGQGPLGAADALADAKAAQKVGAEVRIDGGVEVTAYDDVQVNVTMPAIIQGNETLRVLVGAELDEGRTIVLDVDRETLGAGELRLRYFDVHGDAETEVVFLQASGLEDVLDPADDGGQPEYWIVEDQAGLHILVSVPHWSFHIIEVASVGEFLVQPSVLLGAAAGVAGVAVAGAAMFWPRRRDDAFAN